MRSYIPNFRWISLSSCETRHLRIIISTGGMPSARNRPFILSNICSFSFAGIRIHLFQSVCASASCRASSLVMNSVLLVKRELVHLVSTHVKSVPLLLAVARGGSGLLHGRIYPNTHLERALRTTTTIEGSPPGSGTTENKRSRRI